MNLILEQYQKLLDTIENSSLRARGKEILAEIEKDTLLQAMLQTYHKEQTLEQKMKIYNNDAFLKYKKLEKETNLLILRCNQILKQIKGDDKTCGSLVANIREE